MTDSGLEGEVWPVSVALLLSKEFCHLVFGLTFPIVTLTCLGSLFAPKVSSLV